MVDRVLTPAVVYCIAKKPPVRLDSPQTGAHPIVTSLPAGAGFGAIRAVGLSRMMDLQKQANADLPVAAPVALMHRGHRAAFAGVLHLGSGTAVLESVAQTLGRSPLTVLSEVVDRLLVRKGADWTGPILGEYLGLYGKAHGTFCVVSEKQTGALVAHAAVFRSSIPGAPGLLAHVRTAEGWGSYGLGTLVTATVTGRALAQGASVVILDTDDKLHRRGEGERAAFGLYGRLGYAVLAEKEMVDALGWLMVIDRKIHNLFRQREATGSVDCALGLPTEVIQAQQELIEATRRRYSTATRPSAPSAVRPDDLADLFLLLNLCPSGDFQVKLASWGVVQGPEFERAFVVDIRPAILDRDRLEDASMVLRDGGAGIVAVCAARQAVPFSRQAYHIDFYCVPEFLATHPDLVRDLLEATIDRIRSATDRPRPCRLLHAGVDARKLEVFARLGFGRGANRHALHGSGGSRMLLLDEYEKALA